MDAQIETPLKRLLDEQVKQGTILGFHFFVDKGFAKAHAGHCSSTLNVMPTGPAETFALKTSVPEFNKQDGKN